MVGDGGVAVAAVARCGGAVSLSAGCVSMTRLCSRFLRPEGAKAEGAGDSQRKTEPRNHLQTVLLGQPLQRPARQTLDSQLQTAGGQALQLFHLVRLTGSQAARRQREMARRRREMGTQSKESCRRPQEARRRRAARRAGSAAGTIGHNDGRRQNQMQMDPRRAMHPACNVDATAPPAARPQRSA